MGSRIALVFLVWLASACTSPKERNNTIVIESDLQNYAYELPYAGQIEYQENKSRIWKAHSMELISNFSDSLYSPLEVNMAGAEIYVLDTADGFIKKFSLSGKHISRIGPGMGSGPGEVSLPFDFDISQGNNFFLMDINKRAIIVWDKQGNPIHDHFLNQVSPSKIVAVNDTMAIVMLTGINLSERHGLFGKYIVGTDSVQLYSNYLGADPEIPPMSGLEMALTGNILSNNGDLIYVPKNLSQLLFFDEYGDIKRVREAIDSVDPPKVMSEKHSQTKVMMSKLSPDSREASLDAYIVAGYLVVWSQSGNEKHGSHIFDYYDLETGEYQFSTKIPEMGAVASVKMFDGYVAAINADYSVSVWSFKLEE